MYRCNKHSPNFVWNPTTSLGGAVNIIGGGGGGGGGGRGGAFALSPSQLASFRVIEQNYTFPASTRTYEDIPTDFIQYLNLYQLVTRTRTQYSSNRSLDILLQITQEALTAALNAYGLNTLNIELSVQNTFLQGTIEELLSGQNIRSAYSETSGTLNMTRTLELAPLFVYYMKIYGVPAAGEGFDPNKLSFVLTALENSGIDPYQ